MASRSPTADSGGEIDEDYVGGWAAISTLVARGSSWSGRERNVCFLNLGDGRFADVSWLAGFDFVDDGRAVVEVDWDADGDLDLWVKNRTGPQLRFLRNEGREATRIIDLRLEGRKTNRDAIGARAELDTGSRVSRRWIDGGGGYLSQSSRRLRFVLDSDHSPSVVSVRWPGGETETLSGLKGPGSYRVVEGTGQVVREQRPTVELDVAGAGASRPSAGGSGVLLRTPLPLPPSLFPRDSQSERAGRATLINLWAHWCEPCLVELNEFAEQYAAIHEAGIDVQALSVDVPEDRERAEAMFASIADRMSGPAFDMRTADQGLRESLDAILSHVLSSAGELTLPTSLLVDARGDLQLIYLGPVEPETLLADHRDWVLRKVPGSRRTLTHGRWYFKVPRDLAGLASDLAARGRGEDAGYYVALDRLRRAGPPE